MEVSGISVLNKIWCDFCRFTAHLRLLFTPPGIALPGSIAQITYVLVVAATAMVSLEMAESEVQSSAFY